MWKDILEIGNDCRERFIELTHVPELTSLDIQLAGISDLSGNYRVGRSNPDNHTLFYTRSGAGKLYTETGTYNLQSNVLVILPAKSPFIVELAERESHWDIIWFNLSDSLKWQSLRDKETTIHTNQDLSHLYHLLELLYQEEIATLRQALIPVIGYHLLNTLNISDGHHQEHYRINQLFQEVDNQLHFAWNITNLSLNIHYSAPHLHRLCLKGFGRSPMQQVIYLRMKRAKYLLKHTSWPMAQIGSQVGYPDIFNFSKRFKKSEGVSPSQYRKQFKAGNLS